MNSVGGYPGAVAVGDVDGDGYLDLAAGTLLGQSLVVLFGNGDGTFTERFVSSYGRSPQEVKIADMNGDGRNDLVATDYSNGGSTITVLLRNTGRLFQSPLQYATGSGADGLALAYFDGDGDQDVAAVGYFANSVSILLNNGSGSLSAPVSLVAGTNPVWIATDDFNRDGRPDLVVSNSGSPDLGVFLGKGDGTFQAGVRYATSGSCDHVEIGDINGDGIADIAVSLYSLNRVGVMLGRGDGTFFPVATAFTADSPRGVAVVDLDGNGTMDLATSNYNSNNISLLYNRLAPTNPHLSISAPTTSTLRTPFTVTVRAVDANDQPATTFTGAVQFKSSDRFAQVPANYTFTTADQGVKSFPVTFQSTGNQTLSATLIGSDGIVAGKLISVQAPMAGDLLFNNSVALNFPSAVTVVGAPADFNADGKLDLVNTNFSANTLSVSLGKTLLVIRNWILINSKPMAVSVVRSMEGWARMYLTFRALRRRLW